MDEYKDLLDLFNTKKELPNELTDLEDFTELETICRAISSAFNTQKAFLLLDNLNVLLEYTNQHNIPLNEVMIEYKIPQILIILSVKFEFNEETDENLKESAIKAFSIIENLFARKENKYISYFNDKNFIPIIIENMRHLEPIRLYLALRALGYMVYHYPLMSSQIIEDESIPILTDMVVDPKLPLEIKQAILVLMFRCTIEGSGGHLSELICALDYLASVRIPKTAHMLINIASNICVSRQMGITFSKLDYFPKLVNAALVSEDLDYKSAAIRFVGQVVKWYYNGIHPQSIAPPNFNYEAIAQCITKESDEEIAESALETTMHIIKYGDIALRMLGEHLVERIDSVYHDYQFDTKLQCAMLHAKLIISVGIEQLILEELEFHALEILIENLEIDEDAKVVKILRALVVLIMFALNNDRKQEIYDRLSECEGFDTLDDLAMSDHPAISSRARAILMHFENDE